MSRTRSLLAAGAAAVALTGGAVVAQPSDASAHAELSPRAAATPIRITVSNDMFTPMNRTIVRGKTVKWVWAPGAVTHNVTITGPRGFKRHSANKSTGSYSVTFSSVGTYQVICTIHGSYMTGTLKVVKPKPA